MNDIDKTEEQLIEELRIHQLELEMQNEDLKRAYQELEQSTDRFIDLYDFAPVGYLTINAAGIIVEANLRASHLFGVARSQLIDSPFSRFVFTEDQNIFYLHRQTCLDQLTHETCELRMVKGDGATFNVQIESRPIVEDSEKQGHLRIAIIDITERKQMENLLKENEAKFRSIFETSLDAILLITSDGKILDVNEAACELFGATRQELLDIGRDEILDLTDSGLVPAFERYRREGYWKGQLKNVRADGTIFPVEVSVRELRAPDGTCRDVVVIRDVTERVRAEEALLDSEQKYRLIFNRAPIGMMHFDDNGTVTDCNQKLLEILGASREQAIGFNLLTSVRNEGVLAAFKTALTGKTGSYEGDYTSVTGGRTRSLKMIAVPVPTAGSDRSSVIVIGEDITERKRAEEALREGHQLLQSILSASPVGIGMSRDRVMEWTNGAWKQMFGFENEQEYIGQNVRHLYASQEEYDRVGDKICARLETGKMKSTDARLVRKDGSVFDAHVSMQRLDTSGPEKVTVAAITDISDRKRYEEALRKSEERFSLAMKATTDGVWDWDMTTDEVYRSPDFFSMLGVEPSDFPPGFEGWKQWVHPDDIQQTLAALDDYCSGRTKKYKVEFRMIHADGTPVWVLARGEIVARDKEGKPTRMVGTHTDITARKNLEAQLLQSQKMDALGTLAAGIAHDFNNMLQIILGYADLLVSDKRPGEPGYNELQRIINTSQDAADLVQKIRILSRRADIQRVPSDLNKQLRHVVDLLKHSLPRSVNMFTKLSENLDVVNANPDLVKQMVMNLAVNAAEAMPDGGTLTIETVNTELDDDFCRVHGDMKPGPHVLLSVSDTGRGMSKEMIERLFDPFFSTKERDYHKGTGLGLSVVHGIVTVHSGCITVESETGKGTTFRVYLPSLTSKEGPEVEKEIPDIPSGHETVLLVEDEDTVRHLETTLLEMKGYRVLAVADGQEALEVYEREQANISLVIIDIVMPRMEGKKCMEELLKIDPSVKVLVATGVARDDLIDEVVALGARGSLIKPFSQRDFLERVRDVLDSD